MPNQLLWACTLLVVSGCSLPNPRPGLVLSSPNELLIQQAAHTDDPQSHTVYVMSNGFHSGLVFKSESFPLQAWPESELLADHEWVEISWGSEIFYRAKRISPTVIFGTLLPNPSVLHVVGWDDPPTKIFHGDLIRLEVDHEHFAEMCRFVRGSYKLNEFQRPEDLGSGVYGDSRFFRARGLYYFPKTCNVWTARALDAAGIPIVPELCSTADAVLAFAGRSGTVVRRR